MTHPERAARRKAIANCIQQGMTLAEACISQKVSPKTVYDACQEHGIKIPKALPKQDAAPSSYAILKQLLEGASIRGTANRIAQECKVSRQRVHLIKKAAIEGGFTELAQLQD